MNLSEPVENFRDRIIREFKPQGLLHFCEILWSSSLQREDLPRVRAFLAKNNFVGIDVALVIPPEDTSFPIRFIKRYDSSGECIATNVPVSMPCGSNYLKLTFGYPSTELRDNNGSKIFVVANALRLMFGVPVARELIVRHTFGGGEPLMHSEEGFVSLFDTQGLNMFESPPIEGAELNSMPEDAAFFLDKAFSQEFPNERFVFMWLAFEAVVKAVVEKSSNGRAREEFFKNILQSEIANAEVRRLFGVRNEIFKEARVSGLKIDKDCFSLYCALQLIILKDCEQRVAFLSGYEGDIVSGRFDVS